MFHQNAFSTINDENSKLRTFGMIKSSIGLEKYLKKVKNLKHRISLSRLRLSSHRLMIETGRHKKIAASERFCSFCRTQIEDEIHFVIKCQIYDALRKPLVEACTALNQNFDHYTDREKFIFILTTENLQSILAKFVFLAEEHRSILLQNLKSTDQL